MLALFAVAAIFGTVVYVVLDSRREGRPLPDIRGPNMVQAVVGADVGAEQEPIDVTKLPKGWGKPTPLMIETIEAAANEFEVPREILYGIVRKESNFRPGLRGYVHAGVMKNKAGEPYVSETFQNSYANYRGTKIPRGGGMTWGQMFPTPEDWRPYGLTQLMPYHIVGVPDGVKAGAPLSALFDVKINIRLAAKHLAKLYQKHIEKDLPWDAAVREYNGAESYRKQVAAYASALKQSQAQVA